MARGRHFAELRLKRRLNRAVALVLTVDMAALFRGSVNPGIGPSARQSAAESHRGGTSCPEADGLRKRLSSPLPLPRARHHEDSRRSCGLAKCQVAASSALDFSGVIQPKRCQL
jgi:hypothetical protein